MYTTTLDRCVPLGCPVPDFQEKFSENLPKKSERNGRNRILRKSDSEIGTRNRYPYVVTYLRKMTPFLTKVYFRALDTLRSVSALACPIVGFVARLQTPLTHTRAVGPRVRGLHVVVAPDLCVSGLCPSDLLAINRNFPCEILILGPHPFCCWVFQACPM